MQKRCEPDERSLFAALPQSLDRTHFSVAAARVKRLSDADGAATLGAFTVDDGGRAEARPAAPRAGWSGAGDGETRTSCAGSSDRLGVKVEPVEAIGFDGDSIEAQRFAYLALRSWRGLPTPFRRRPASRSR